MIISEQDIDSLARDTSSVLQETFIEIRDTSLKDTTGVPLQDHKTDPLHAKAETISTKAPVNEKEDSTAVCSRNIIADITFYDSTSFIRTKTFLSNDYFPFSLIEKSRELEKTEKISLMKNLREGIEFPARLYHDDWLIFILLIAGFLYGAINILSKNFYRNISRFLFISNIGDHQYSDTGGLFEWKTTLINLISFFIIALFLYHSNTYYDLIKFKFPGIFFWLISSGIVSAVVTIRHLTCYLTGSISDEQKAFSEYINTIYLGYQLWALVLFFIIIMISYLHFIPVKYLLYAGFLVFIIIYLIRIMRLFLIFIKRGISIFYLILYLCALEFLPVVVFVRYFTGLR